MMISYLIIRDNNCFEHYFWQFINNFVSKDIKIKSKWYKNSLTFLFAIIFFIIFFIFYLLRHVSFGWSDVFFFNLLRFKIHCVSCFCILWNWSSHRCWNFFTITKCSQICYFYIFTDLFECILLFLLTHLYFFGFITFLKWNLIKSIFDFI